MKSLRLEAMKTQLICGRCHVGVTVERRSVVKGYDKNTQSKYDYVDALKQKSECVLCKSSPKNNTQFFEYDHIDPSKKSASIAEMCNTSIYALDDVKYEINKCRLLCRHCHRIHTYHQKHKINEMS